MDRKSSVIAYFNTKADQYDLVDTQPYWVLSDRILWDILTEKLAAVLESPSNAILDAGAGTGRWGLRLAAHFSRKVHSFDISPEMIRVAQKKSQKDPSLEESATFEVADIDTFKASRPFEAVLVLHNVLSFVPDPLTSIRSLAAATKRGGLLAAAVGNQYHALYFNIANRRTDQLQTNFKDKEVKFTETMPPMRLFTPEELKLLFREAGFSEVEVLGFPVTIYPSTEETTIKHSNAKLKDLLEDKDVAEEIFSIEKTLSRKEEAAARGNILLVIARK